MTSEPLICKGWKIYFHPLFTKQYEKLESRVVKLSAELPESEFKSHESVKLFAALTIGIEEKIPLDPFASHFALTKEPLRKYCRLKKMGLNERYRLFFRAFKQEKTIVILWLGFPRKEGDKKDCYVVFTKKVSNGVYPETIEAFIAECIDNQID